jgi:hypothetical protein
VFSSGCLVFDYEKLNFLNSLSYLTIDQHNSGFFNKKQVKIFNKLDKRIHNYKLKFL